MIELKCHPGIGPRVEGEALVQTPAFDRRVAVGHTAAAPTAALFGSSTLLQNVLLPLASYAFYAAWDWRFSLLLIGSSVVNYWFAPRIARDQARRGPPCQGRCGSRRNHPGIPCHR